MLDQLQFIALISAFPVFFLPPLPAMISLVLSPVNYFIPTPAVASFASASNVTTAGVTWYSQTIGIPHTALQLTADIFIAALFLAAIAVYGVVALVVYCLHKRSDRIGDSIRAYAVAVVARAAMTPYYSLGVSCAYHLVAFVKPEPMYFVAAIIVRSAVGWLTGGSCFGRCVRTIDELTFALVRDVVCSYGSRRW